MGIRFVIFNPLDEKKLVLPAFVKPAHQNGANLTLTAASFLGHLPDGQAQVTVEQVTYFVICPHTFFCLRIHSVHLPCTSNDKGEQFCHMLRCGPFQCPAFLRHCRAVPLRPYRQEGGGCYLQYARQLLFNLSPPDMSAHT